jgi:DNA-binding transcriptional LysR family regulator
VRIEQLEYIAAVTQHGSLRRAGEALHLSQPALSEAVSRLERELGVTLLDRHRSGARISRRGRELQQHMVEVLEAVERLRTAAGDQTTSTRVVRVGTVSTATSTLLVPAVSDVRSAHPLTTVEVVNTQQADLDQGLLDGSLDLGLVNVLEEDDPAPGLVGQDLVHGRAVVVVRGDHPFAQQDEVRIDQLRTEPFVAMRAGYLMHRFSLRLFGSLMPPVCYTTDGAELGKVMVAEGLGFTVLPDYSVAGDPLERAGLITARPISGDRTPITLVLRSRPRERVPHAVRDLRTALVAHASAYRRGTAAGSPTSQGT